MTSSDIYTICLNPSIDYSFYIENIVFDDINRIKKSRVDIGGKGINISKMLNNLDKKTTVITLIGGENGNKIKEFLKEKKIKHKFFNVEGNVRNIFNFFTPEKTLRFNESGPKIKKEEKEEFFHLLENIKFKSGDMVVMSGSIPPGFEKNTYRRIVEKVKKYGVIPVVDADGEVLRESIKGIPEIIKANLWEIERATGKKIKKFSTLKNCILKLIEKGIRIIIITFGEKGAILFTRDKFFYCKVPKVKLKSSVGCGDAFLAGFLYKYSENNPLADCLKFACACGTAKAGKEGTEMPEKREIMEIYKKMVWKVKSLVYQRSQTWRLSLGF